MVIYRSLADLVVLLHAAYVSFVVFGFGLIVLGAVLRRQWVRNFWFRLSHLAAILIVCVEAVTGIVCPLTSLENQLRAKAGQSGYPGDFIGHLAHELIFSDLPPWVLTVIYVLFGLLVLAAFLVAPPRIPWRSTTK